MRCEDRTFMRNVMNYLFHIMLAALLMTTAISPTFAQANNDGLPNKLRGSTPLARESTPSVMPKMVNDDVRRGRAFAMQPPVIPHQIENYQIDKNFNQCMTCHGRDRVTESQAPMVSVTHFMDRNGDFRAEISPRRYFCNQCHVPQHEVKAPVENRFVDAEQARKTKKAAGK